MFEQVVDAHLQNSRRQLTAAQRLKVVEGNLFEGSSVKDHRWMISPPIPRYTRASLRQVGVSSLTPLLKKLHKANGEVEPLGTGADTHTHTAPLCGARANDLNRYLKSLIIETKETQKEQR